MFAAEPETQPLMPSSVMRSLPRRFKYFANKFKLRLFQQAVMIEINAVGGYNEIGKNMTAVKVDNEVIIFDMGLHLDLYITYTEEEDMVPVTSANLRKVGAIPDDK